MIIHLREALQENEKKKNKTQHNNKVFQLFAG